MLPYIEPLMLRQAQHEVYFIDKDFDLILSLSKDEYALIYCVKAY